MPILTGARWRRLSLTTLVCAGLLLAACTRSASTQNVLPTATLADGSGLVVDGNQDATMAAIATELTSQLTQTAVAAGGLPTQPVPGETPAGGGGEVATPVPPTPGLPGATETTGEGVATSLPPPGATSCTNPYTVQSGDWIYKIARTCGLNPKAIIAANPGINPNYLVPGQVINLPTGATGGTTPPIAGCTGTHTVVSGDTLFRLSYNCGITVEQLAAANNIAYPYTIYPGQVLRYP